MGDLVPTEQSALERAQTMSPDIQEVVLRAVATGRYGGGNAFMMQALNAASLEEATDIGTVVSARDHLNERMRFIDVQFLDSDPSLESPVPIFAVATVAREMNDGVIEKLSCGAGHVLGVLIMACEKNLFPFDAELVSVDLGGGRKAINLQLAPTRVKAEQDF